MAGRQAPGNDLQRYRYSVKGQVQGVGFRPFVFRLASRFHLDGFVCNDNAGVSIEVQGPENRLEAFQRALLAQGPPLALIQKMVSCEIPLGPNARGFSIGKSMNSEQRDAAAPAGGGFTIDSAVCAACRKELFEPRDRRYGYGLINCTDCGPRYTILQSLPYDRPNTTMKHFVMCGTCASEYERPSDRRFHAQPNACSVCGPAVRLADTAGRPLQGDPFRGAAALLAGGRVLAVKGLGGFHLAVRADDPASVECLRLRKNRQAKPFALMSRSLAEAERAVKLGSRASALLQSPRAPVVLAARAEGAPAAESVAPGMHRLGVMLPYTPIHHLLFEALDPEIGLLVMTSGNLSNEPLVTDNREALTRLRGICDAVLLHDRPIERCVDDSVHIDLGELGTLPIRRARGYVPSSLPLPAAPCREAGLALGGEQKNTLAVVLRGEAVLSQHLGDLTEPLNFELFRRTAIDLCTLFDAEPAWVAHDLHPLYMSTLHAKSLADERKVPRIAVQHHHAHAASLLAEHGETGPALVIVCDGTGYGEDGSVWGGELLLADLLRSERLAHLRTLRLAGGDRAAGDVRRCGLALLHQALGRDFDRHPAADGLVPDPSELHMFRTMIDRRVQCAESSSAGRVFDGTAALLGICTENTYDAEAAMRLEAACALRPPARQDPPLFRIEGGGPLRIDLSPLVLEILLRKSRGVPGEELSALFHDQFARAWVRTIEECASNTGVRTVGLSGGVFCNQRITERILAGLSRSGFRVLRHREVPPNDGGLALGQAAIASARVRAGCVRVTPR